MKNLKDEKRNDRNSSLNYRSLGIGSPPLHILNITVLRRKIIDAK
jgi:hypothetical protein